METRFETLVSFEKRKCKHIPQRQKTNNLVSVHGDKKVPQIGLKIIHKFASNMYGIVVHMLSYCPCLSSYLLAFFRLQHG